MIRVEKISVNKGQVMVSNAMYPIGQRPTFITNRKIKRKEEEESSKSSNAEKEVEEEPQVLKHEGNDEFTKAFGSDSSSSVAQAPTQNFVASPVNVSNISYKNINPEINIAQILKDYKNTENAIGTPPEIQKEVESYLSLVDTEVKKESPNTKIVKSNLKNAAMILDGYITETLQRPSKVVENWADALFLQQINYKYDESDVNEQFLVKFPHKNDTKTEASEKVANSSNTDAANTNEKLSIQIPDDSQLANLFIKAKKYTTTNDSQNALKAFTQALSRSDEVGDNETKAKVMYEIGQIYDKNNLVSKALTSYNDAAELSTDSNVKTKSYYAMAQIYDDYSHLEPAINNYMTSVSYAGEAENFNAQSTSLTKIGNILTDKYDKNAFDFYSVASNMADVADNSKIKGYVSSNTADAYVQFQKPQDALKSYFDAVKNYSNADSTKKVAQNYQKAAQVMAQYGNTDKAKSLLTKAQKHAAKTGDMKLLAEINSEMSLL